MGKMLKMCEEQTRGDARRMFCWTRDYLWEEIRSEMFDWDRFRTALFVIVNILNSIIWEMGSQLRDW